MDLDRLLYGHSGYSAAENRVAEVVMAEPDTVTRMSVRALAEKADVSEPTVIRFCRTLGCEGFTDFKLRLAESLVVRPVGPLPDIQAKDEPADVVTKVFSSAERALATASDVLDPAQVAVAATALSHAKTIWFFGYGASGVVAADARHKFLRLGVPCADEQDPHNQLIIAASARKGDAVVAISHTGRSEDLLGVIDEAARSGATTVALTRAGTPLAERCDHVVHVATDEDTGVYTPSKSRLVHLVVVDCLATLVALSQGRAFGRRQQSIKGSLQRTRTSELFDSSDGGRAR